jgi:hypothetical protein
MSEELQDVTEYENWDEIDYSEQEEAMEVITPPPGVYDLTVLSAKVNPDTHWVSFIYRIHQAVHLRDKNREKEVEPGMRVAQTIFPPKAGERRKDDRGVGTIMKMSRVLLSQKFGTDLSMDDFLTQMGQIYGPDTGNFIRVTISNRADRKNPGVFYSDLKLDFRSVDQEGNEL